MSEEERNLFAWVLLLNEKALAWNEDEKGGFNEKFIPAVKIPVISHVPWQSRPIRLPLKTREEVVAYLRKKIKGKVNLK